MTSARFFFDAGSGTVLWVDDPEGQAIWGYAVDLDELPISPELQAELIDLVAEYDTSLNWEYPPDPGPWREAQCDRFNAATREALSRLRTELGPTWRIEDGFTALHEDPDLDRYLRDPKGFVRGATT
ncbi:hypothetical protein AB0J14_08190 [Micromonospora arborensis]|uniref:hypothetical protein n=1 Tax=Micromonospora arborensis TaxID=2116518 RepID=UPI0033E42B06